MLGVKLIVSMITSGKVADFYHARLNPEYFVSDELDVYLFTKNHVEAYSVLPALGTLEEKFGSLSTAPEPYDYYLEQIEHRFGFKCLNKTLQKSSDLLKQKNVQGIIDAFTDVANKLTNSALRSSVVDWVADGHQLVKAQSEKDSAGGEGLRLGWDYLDDLTSGLVAGDILSVVGRPASGKTYCNLWMGYSVYKQGKKVLFLSMEMSPVSICQRMHGIHNKLNMTELKKGEISDFTWPLIDASMAILAAAEDELGNYFKIVDGNMNSRVDELAAFITQYKPDLVIVDGAYLLKHTNTKLDRFTRAAENIEALKKLAGVAKLPMILSYQLNRESTKKKKGDAAGLEDIGYTDAVGQISSVVLALMQPESTETTGQREITILKGRDGQAGKFDINWRFDKLDFSQIDFAKDGQEVFHG